MDAAIGSSSAHIGVDATAGNAARRALVSSLVIKWGSFRMVVVTLAAMGCKG